MYIKVMFIDNLPFYTISLRLAVRDVVEFYGKVGCVLGVFFNL